MSYRDEEVATLYRRIADLEDALRAAPKAQPKIKREWVMPKIEDAFAWTAYAALTVLACIVLWALAHVMFVNSKIDYCYANYADAEEPHLRGDFIYLKAHRTWATDIVLSKHASFHDAALAAAEMSCPLSAGVIK